MERCPVNVAEVLGLYTREPQFVAVVRAGRLPAALRLLDAAGVDYLALPRLEPPGGFAVYTSGPAPAPLAGLLVEDGRCEYRGADAATAAHLITCRLREDPGLSVTLSGGWAARVGRARRAIEGEG